MDGEISVLSNCGTTLGILSSFQVRPRLLLRCDGNVGIPFHMSRVIDTHLKMRRGKRGSSSVVVGNLVFLSSEDGYLRELLELHKGCQVPF